MADLGHKGKDGMFLFGLAPKRKPQADLVGQYVHLENWLDGL